MFNKVVKPVMLYGSAIWGAKNCKLADMLQIKYLKIILGLKKCTSILIVRCETGCYPLSIDIKMSVLNFWFKLVNNLNNKISLLIYHCMLRMCQDTSVDQLCQTNTR